MARQVPGQADKFEIKSKVMILLTDGQQTAGKRKPVEAAKLAKEWGIKIYAIAVGGQEEMRSQDTLFGRFLQLGGAPQLDTRDLEAVAKETGGEVLPHRRRRLPRQSLQGNRRPGAKRN